MAERRKKIIKGALVLLGIGALYALVVTLLGRGIPCPIRLATGYECPGCGVSRMLLALMQLDFAAAFEANAALLCLLPLLLFAAGRLVYVYIRRGTTRDRAAETVIWIAIPLLLVWGVVRNII
ncbi:MAG: DUF2752 domain-containing protein [Clostridia bacterium]|nr:DUF2752 domain-containing protein [Clostridia bacterium]